MNSRRGMARAFVCAMWLFTLGTAALAAPAESPDQKGEKGFVFYEQFEGSSNTLGQVFKLDTSAGYNFNKYFGVDAGIPVYFVPSSGTSSTTGSTSNNGVGNVYADVRFTLDNPVVNFASTLTGTAPTGDTAKGLSTGRGTIDWNNHFDRTFARLTPFANLGVANTVSDTHFFNRPFSTLGLVGHFEGGGSWKVWRFVSVGASGYDILPSGQQKVFSKLIRRQPSTSPSTASTSTTPGKGRHGAGVFEKQAETVGTSDIARDDGYSAWIGASPSPFVDLEVGFNRSVRYNLNTASFTLGLNLGYFVKKARGH